MQRYCSVNNCTDFLQKLTFIRRFWSLGEAMPTDCVMVYFVTRKVTAVT